MYDVIIVGGGVAGAYLASKLDGLNVLLIEKNKNIVLKDSGIVSKDFLDFFGENFIKNEINRMSAFSPSGHMFTLNSRKPFAYIIRREIFSHFLRINARKNATIVYDNVLGVKFGRDSVSVHGVNCVYEGKIVVGADGANSIVRRYARIQRPFLSLGVMVKTKNKLDGNINVFFNKFYSPDFFSWVIPQNNEYGTISSVRPRIYLKHFKKDQFLPAGEIYAYLIPTGYVKSYGNRLILVGDACGQNKPLTGGGIMFSLMAATHAAETISAAFGNNRFDERFFKKYESAWKKDFAWEIDKQFLLRMLYRNLTNADIDHLFMEIGPNIDTLETFDYDRFSRALIKLPKLKMLKLGISLGLGLR